MGEMDMDDLKFWNEGANQIARWLKDGREI